MEREVRKQERMSDIVVKTRELAEPGYVEVLISAPPGTTFGEFTVATTAVVTDEDGYAKLIKDGAAGSLGRVVVKTGEGY